MSYRFTDDGLGDAYQGIELIKAAALEADPAYAIAGLLTLDDGYEDRARKLAFAWALMREQAESTALLFKGDARKALVRALKKLGSQVEVEPAKPAASGASAGPGPGPDPATWDKLEVVKNTVRPTLNNLAVILETDPRWAGRLRLNVFAHAVELDGAQVTDQDELAIQRWINQTYGVEYPTARVHEAVVSAAGSDSYHPVVSMLEGLTWDGMPRLETWLQQYVGCAADKLSAVYGKRFLVGAVARVMDPGCQMEDVLILHGPQGARKSTVFRVLAQPWFSDSPLKIDDKDGAQVLAGTWFWEFAELNSISRRENETVKAYLSTRADRYRPSFGRNTVNVSRQNVFVGTTNKDDILTDPSGSRRYRVRTVGEIDIDGLVAVKDQLWAEAVHLYHAGEQWHLTPQENALREVDAQAYSDSDTWDDVISDATAEWSRKVTLREILEGALGIKPADQTKQAQGRAAESLHRLGWTKLTTRGPRDSSGSRPRLWAPPATK